MIPISQGLVNIKWPISSPAEGAQLTLVTFPLSFIKELHRSPQLPFKEEKRVCSLCC